jgi:CRP/FNR family cyclic AMP-dependent transcriptional regulator
VRPSASPSGPVENELRVALQRLREQAGGPSLREIGAVAGVSHDTAYRVLADPLAARWEMLKLVVRALGGDLESFYALWASARPRIEDAPRFDEPEPGEDSSDDRPFPAMSLLGRLSVRSREDFLAVGVSRSWEAGETLYHRDMGDAHAVLMLHGFAKVVAQEPGGDRTLLDFRLAGDLVGAMARPGGDVVAGTDVLGKLMTMGELNDFLTRTPDVILDLAAVLQERLHWSERRRVEYARPASARIAGALADLYQTYGTRKGGSWELGVPLTREELASLGGVKLSTAEKTIRVFQQNGLVSARYRGLVVLDMPGLRQAAESV